MWRYLVISVLPLFLNTAFANSGYPGLPPDCWTEARNVHGGYAIGDYLEERFAAQVSVSHEDLEDTAGYENISPNKAYAFAVDGFRPDVRVSVYAEKEHTIRIDLKNILGVTDAKWVNEKLIFLRAWWGRLMFTDVLFDVENESFVYRENGMDGSLAYAQFQESCKILGGCRCVDKTAQEP